MSIDVDVLRESWALVADASDKVAAYFYGMLFSRYPAVREMFPAAMDVQRHRLLKALTHVVLHLDDLEALTAYLGELARDHRKYGVRAEHYPAVGGCLVAAMRANAGGTWKPAYDEAWTAAYEMIATVMIRAADEDAGSSPPYWTARVVAHERRSYEIAVVTVEPSQPYPFHAGQYATIQTARWRRIWRPYSIANAPRRDNLVMFHVRLVPAGWVSTTLVAETSVGDELTLGPPRGKMILPAPRPKHLLCVAGGTGLAPLKAIAEEALRTTGDSNITLIHGVRPQEEIYDAADLTRLSETSDRFHLVTVMPTDRTHPPQQSITEMIELRHVEHWPTTFVCGPSEMVSATLGRLAELGVPAHRIRSESQECASPDGSSGVRPASIRQP